MVTTRSAYIKQIDQLDGHVSVIGQAVVEDIRNTALAIGEGNKAAAQEVADGHDAFERLHRNVEDTCMSLMLLQQPMASDLRLVTASFRAISDLARIDEMAYEIALLAGEFDLTIDDGIARILGDMSQRAASMAEKATEAFRDSDVDVANSVFPMDDKVDDLFESVRSRVVEMLRSGSEPATIAPELLTVAKYYERMGDHAQGIADWAVFRATGEYRGRSMGEMA